MKRPGRKEPYTEAGIQRMPCARCGQPSTQQWKVCADGLHRPICTACDVKLNRVVLAFMNDPDVDTKITAYQEYLNV